MNSNNEKWIYGIAGALIGTLVGGSLALIFAPKSGEDLRKDINKDMKELLDQAEEWKESAYKKGSELTQQVKDTTSDLTETVTDKTKDVVDDVKDAADKL